jgi:hypothetical protein
MKFFTKTLNNGDSLTISAEDGAMMLSIQPNGIGATCTFLGGIAFKGEAPSAIFLTNSQVCTVASPSPVQPLDGITIEATNGDTDIIIGL